MTAIPTTPIVPNLESESSYGTEHAVSRCSALGGDADVPGQGEDGEDATWLGDDVAGTTAACGGEWFP